MTWKEFKDKVESFGVKDESEIRYIDISGYHPFGAVQSDADNEWCID